MKTTLIIFFIAFLLCVAGINNEVEGSYTLQPLLFRISMERGEMQEYTLTVKNTGDSGQSFNVYHADYTLNRKGDNTFVKLGDSEHSAAQLIDFTESTIFLEAGEKREIYFNIYIPPTLEPGEYYAAIIAQSMEPVVYTGDSYELERYSAIAPLLIIDVPSRSIIRKKASVLCDEFEVVMPNDDKITFYNKIIEGIRYHRVITEKAVYLLVEHGYSFQYGEYLEETDEVKAEIAYDILAYFRFLRDEENTIRIAAPVKNESSIMVRAEGMVNITDEATGRLYDQFPLVADLAGTVGDRLSAQVFPMGIRDFVGEVRRPLPPGNYEAEVIFDYGVPYREARARASFYVSDTMAQTQKELLTLKVQPEYLRLKVNPGGMLTESITITNQDINPLSVRVEAISEGLDRLTISPTVVNLRPGQSRNIRIMAKIPREAEYKYSARLIFVPEQGKHMEVDLLFATE